MLVAGSDRTVNPDLVLNYYMMTICPLEAAFPNCRLNVFRFTIQVRPSGSASYATHGVGAMVLVNVMRIPFFGRRMTIGRASIIWPAAN
jgi:hypothetical protein